jgi:integrase
VTRKDIIPACRHKLISEIAKVDVNRMLDVIVDRGAPIAANETLSIAKRWLRWCVGRGYLSASPIADVEAPAAKKSRDRVLSDDELRDVWDAAESLGYPCGPFLRLLILTAQRRGEVAAMRWQDVDLERALWTLSAEQTKAGRVHDVPLSTAALAILNSLPRFEGAHVFTTGNGAKPINSFSKLATRLEEAMGKTQAAFVLHDIRRTAATHLAKMGTPPHVLAALLNHSPGSAQGVTAIYNRFRYVEERREALEAWAEHVLKLAEKREKRPTRVA